MFFLSCLFGRISGIRPDTGTGYQKRPDYPAGYPASQISGASLVIIIKRSQLKDKML